MIKPSEKSMIVPNPHCPIRKNSMIEKMIELMQEDIINTSQDVLISLVPKLNREKVEAVLRKHVNPIVSKTVKEIDPTPEEINAFILLAGSKNIELINLLNKERLENCQAFKDDSRKLL